MEHEAQTKADWEDTMQAWRREEGSRPQAYGAHGENRKHQPDAGTLGRGR